MKCNRFSIWYQSTNYTAQEEENEDSRGKWKNIRNPGWLTAGGELGSPAQDSWATSIVSQNKILIILHPNVLSSLLSTTTKNHADKGLQQLRGKEERQWPGSPASRRLWVPGGLQAPAKVEAKPKKAVGKDKSSEKTVQTKGNEGAKGKQTEVTHQEMKDFPAENGRK